MLMTFFFVFFSVLAIAAAVLMITHKNPVYSALFLIVTFFAIAGFYFLLGAQFLAIVQIIVYAGAIMVLFLFVMMLLNLRREVRLPLGRPLQIALSSLLAVALLLQILFVTISTLQTKAVGDFPPEKIDAVGSVEALGGKLFTAYLYPFEAASVLLLVGIVGAIILGRKKLPKEM